jgi:hypothetical protein
MADVCIRRGHSKLQPVTYRWRHDTLDNFLQDVLDEKDTNYARDSMKGKEVGFEWASLIKNATPKAFKFGV